MPYFQRDPAASLGSQAGAESAAAAIVDRAAAILEREAGRDSANPPTSARRAGNGDLIPAASLADLQKYVTATLEDLLRLVGQFAPVAQSEQQKTAGNRAASALAAVPVIQPARSAKASEAMTVTVALVNEGAAPISFIFYSTDFVSDNGHQIPAVQVSFSPRVLALTARAQGQSEMTVAVPAQSAAGTYSALVQATGLGRPCAVVVIQVE